MDILTKTGALRARTEGWSYSGTFMGERSLTCEVSSPVPVDFRTGDYTLLAVRDGVPERFELEGLPTVKKTASTGSHGDAYHYTLRLAPLQYELQRCVMNDLILGEADAQRVYTGQSVWSTYGTARELADRILANLNRLYRGAEAWTIDVKQEGEAALLSFDNATCWDALTMAQTVFGLKFTIVGRRITIGSLGEQIDHPFRYGKGGGIYDLTRMADEGTEVVTRLKAYGSDRNLPADYYRQTGDDSRLITRLMLPGYRTDRQDYIESANAAQYGIREGVQIFEQVYPTIEGVTGEQLRAGGLSSTAEGRVDEIVSMASIAKEEQGECSVVIKDPGFNLAKCIREGETPLISMRDGWLGGREFEITSCLRTLGGTPGEVRYTLTIKRIQDAGLNLPNNTLRLKAGDRFVLLGISMPHAYVAAAEQRLLTEARAYLAGHDHTRTSYNLTIDNVGMARIPTTAALLAEGNLMRVVDEDLGIDERIPIQGITVTEGTGGIREYSVTLSQESAPSRLGMIAQAIKEQHATVALAQQQRTKEARRTWSGITTLREALFDPDSGAQQELLRTMMLQVGADSMNYRMDRTRWRENAGENLSFTERSITLGTDTLRHYCFGIGAEKASDWTVAGPATRDDLDPNTLYYVAVKARTDRPEAEWYVSDRSCGVNDLEGYYVFQFGLLGAAAEGVRTFIETRGMSTLYGDNLTVGRIRSLDGTSYFDLTTGELCVKGDNARIDKYDFLARSFMPDDTTEVAGGVVLSNFIGVKNGGNIQAGMTGGTYRAGEELKRVPLLFAGASSLAEAGDALFTITDNGQLVSRSEGKSIRIENGRLSLCDRYDLPKLIIDPESKTIAAGDCALANAMASNSGQGTIQLNPTVTFLDEKQWIGHIRPSNYDFSGTQPLSGAFTVGENCNVSIPAIRLRCESDKWGSFSIDYLNMELCQNGRVVETRQIVSFLSSIRNTINWLTPSTTFQEIHKGTYTLRLSVKGNFRTNLELTPDPGLPEIPLIPADPFGPKPYEPELEKTEADAPRPASLAGAGIDDSGLESQPRSNLIIRDPVVGLRLHIWTTSEILIGSYDWEERTDQATFFNNGLLLARSEDNYIGMIIDGEQAVLEQRCGANGFRLSGTGQFIRRNNRWELLQNGGSTGAGNVTAPAPLTGEQLIVGAGSTGIKASGKSIAASVTNSTLAVPTSAAVYSFVNGKTTSTVTSGSPLLPTAAAVYAYAPRVEGTLDRNALLFARDSHTVGTTPHPQYVSTSIAADETDHRNIPTAQAVKQYVASRLPEAGEWYNIHTYKCDPHLSTVIETASVTPAMMDTSKYRLVLYRFRKHASEGRRWRIPMLPYEHQLRINPRAEVHSAIPYNRTFWQITGTTVPWWNGQAELKDVLSLTANASYQRWSNTNNKQMRIGVAICKYTGKGTGLGWQRISNIAEVKLFIYEYDSVLYRIEPVI